jgi:chemotaxis protein CheC
VNAPLLQPTDLQLDALREVANIGCGQAANALSRLLGGQRVCLSLPRAVVVPLRELPSLVGGAEAPVVAAVLEMGGGLSGHLLMVASAEDARRLVAMLLGGAAEGAPAQLGESALAEVANILASACLNAISRLVGLTLVPSPPVLDSDVAQAVVRRALLADVKGEGRAVVLEARFQTPGQPGGAEGQLLLVPGPHALSVLLARLGV